MNNGSLTYAEMAERLRVSEASLYRWVRSGQMMGPVRMGRLARFSVAIVEQLEQQGLAPVGTYRPKPSPWSKAGKLGAEAKKAIAARRKKERPRAGKGRAKK